MNSTSFYFQLKRSSKPCKCLSQNHSNTPQKSYNITVTHSFIIFSTKGEGNKKSGDGENASDNDDDADNKNGGGGVESDIEELKEDERLPKSDWKEPEPIRAEKHHSGTNRYVYFVCNKLGDGWTRLPHANPADIVSSRHISKLLTGELNTTINSYPPFSGGTEAIYLRAQIARISACTQISPTGFFVFDDEGAQGDEEDEIRDSYMVNLAFEGIPVRQLKGAYSLNWVHHNRYILPQGRCTWWSPNQKHSEDYDEDEVCCCCLRKK